MCAWDRYTGQPSRCITRTRMASRERRRCRRRRRLWFMTTRSFTGRCILCGTGSGPTRSREGHGRTGRTSSTLHCHPGSIGKGNRNLIIIRISRRRNGRSIQNVSASSNQPYPWPTPSTPRCRKRRTISSRSRTRIWRSRGLRWSRRRSRISSAQGSSTLRETDPGHCQESASSNGRPRTGWRSTSSTAWRRSSSAPARCRIFPTSISERRAERL